MTLLIADASPIVGFACSQKHQILVDVVARLYGHILVPYEVDAEIVTKTAQKNRAGVSAYAWMKAQGHVIVLPQAHATGPTQQIAAFAAALLDTVTGGITARMKNKGEAFAVAHARIAIQQGTATHLLVDDGGGTDWAHRYSIQTYNTVWVFAQAIHFGFITDKDDLTTTYRAVRTHSRLPELAKTPLLQQLTDR